MTQSIIDHRLHKLLTPKWKKRELHAHNMIVETARDLCLATYEELMKNNAVRAEWKRKNPGKGEQGLQAAFVRAYLRAHIAPARTTLAGMLGQPYDAAFKDKIHEALVPDNTLVRGRNPEPGV